MREGIKANIGELESTYTFSNFIEGWGNRMACAAAKAVVASPGAAYNPLFIYGKVGRGKTHLLHAIGNAIGRESGAGEVVVISAEKFMSTLIQSIQVGNENGFRSLFRDSAAFLLDDVHFLKERDWSQEELYHIFNEFHESKRQVVFSSDRSPRQLQGFQKRLLSRFSWGVVSEITAPNLETRLAILKNKAEEAGISLGEDVLFAIAKRVSTSVRALEGALAKISAHLELQGGNLKQADLDELLPLEEAGSRSVSIAEIKALVAAHYEVSVSDLEGDSRAKAITHARQVAIFLARELTNSSFPLIGAEFGNRNHSTIMHACHKIKNLLRTPLFAQELSELQRELPQE